MTSRGVITPILRPGWIKVTQSEVMTTRGVIRRARSLEGYLRNQYMRLGRDTIISGVKMGVHLSQFLTLRIGLRLVLGLPHLFWDNSTENSRCLLFALLDGTLVECFYVWDRSGTWCLETVVSVVGPCLEILNFPSQQIYPSNDIWRPGAS